MKPCLFINTLFLLLAIATPSAWAGHSSSNNNNVRKLKDDQQALFDQAFARWTSITSSFPNNMVDYTFAYLDAKYEGGIPRFQVQVRNSTELKLDIYMYPLILNDTYFTIDQLMTFISGSLSTSEKDVTVTYDELYGYPTSWKVELNDTTLEGEMYSFTFYSVLKQQLDESKAIWNSQEIDSYDCTMRLIGFLPPSFTMPMNVEVRNGVITGIFYEETGEMADMNQMSFPTIDQAFGNIDNALSNYYGNVYVTYDATLGFPSEYSLKESLWIPDAGPTFLISNLVAVEDQKNTAGNGTIVDDEESPEEWQKDLDAAKTLWQAQNLSAYNYTYQRSCECPPEYQAPKLVHVVDGMVIAVNDSPVQVTQQSPLLPLDEAPTLDILFMIIQNAINANAFRVSVEYDEEHGYPTSIAIDYDEMIADEEFVVTAKLEGVSGGEGPVDPKSPEEELAAAMLFWETKAITNYHFGILRQCECAFAEPIVTQVSNGEVTQMKTRYGDKVYQNETGYSLTIDDIFVLIKDGMDSNFSNVKVTYDEEYGYPKSVAVDPSDRVADDEYTLTIDYLAPLTEWQTDLEAGKTLWQAQNLSTYNYTYQLSCGECPYDYQKAKLVHVVDDVVVAVNGSPIQSSLGSSSLSFDDVPTLDELFALIQDAINANAFQLGVTYDEEYGYPTSIGIDYDEMIIDEEFGVSAKLVVNNDGDGDVVDPESKDALDAAKLIWDTKAITNYHFGILKQCRCRFTDRIATQVSNGEVIQMKTRYGGEVYQNETGYSLTIEDVFDLIENGIDSNFSTVEVTYDEEYGYPKSVVLDPSDMVADDEYTLTIDYLAPLTVWQTDLEASKTLWKAQNLSTYNYTYQRSCECPPAYQKAKLVQVVDGMVVAIDHSPVQATQRSSSLSFDEVPTLDKLFTIIQDAINANAFRVSVEYDEEHGYPTSVGIDYDEMIADEEFFVTAKLEEANDNGSRGNPDPFSSASKTSATIGQLKLACMLLFMTW